MRTLGILVIILGIVLKIVKAFSPGIYWTVIIVGFVLLIASYFIKARKS